MADTIDSDSTNSDRGWKRQCLAAVAREVVDDRNGSVSLVAQPNYVGGSVAGLSGTDTAVADILCQTACVNELGEAHGEVQIEELVISDLYSVFRHGSEPMSDNAEVRRQLMRAVLACLDREATARDFLAFAAPYALDDELEDELRGDLDRLLLVADEVDRFGLAEEVFLEAVRDVSRRDPSMEFAPAAD